jgi:hypothetical protein
MNEAKIPTMVTGSGGKQVLISAGNEQKFVWGKKSRV